MRKHFTLFLSALLLMSVTAFAGGKDKKKKPLLDTETSQLLGRKVFFEQGLHTQQSSLENDGPVYRYVPGDITAMYYTNNDLLAAWTEEFLIFPGGVTGTGAATGDCTLANTRLKFKNITTGFETVVTTTNGFTFGGFGDQGGHANLALPQLGYSADGAIYITFGVLGKTEADTSVDGLHFARAYYVKSTDLGQTWSNPIVIEDTDNIDCRYVGCSVWNEANTLNVAYMRRANRAGTVVQEEIPATDTAFIVYRKINTQTGVPGPAVRTGIKTLTYDYLTNPGADARIIAVDSTSNGQIIHVTYVTALSPPPTWPDRNSGYAFSTDGGTTWESTLAISANRSGFPYMSGLIDIGETNLTPIVLYHGARATASIGSFGTTNFSEFVSPLAPTPAGGAEALIWPKGNILSNNQAVVFTAGNSGGTGQRAFGSLNLADLGNVTFNSWVTGQVRADSVYAPGGIVVTGPGGRVAVFYKGRFFINSYIRYFLSTDGGATFGSVNTLATTGPPIITSSTTQRERFADFRLAQNYPNPFNPTTNITYVLPKTENVSLKVYDVLGREVATLVNEVKPAGAYTVPFNASNLASGVYFYKLQAGSFVQTKKMMLVK